MKGNVLYGSICNDRANRIMELGCHRKMAVFVPLLASQRQYIFAPT